MEVKLQIFHTVIIKNFMNQKHTLAVVSINITAVLTKLITEN
jgi:hypothetical protein